MCIGNLFNLCPKNINISSSSLPEKYTTFLDIHNLLFIYFHSVYSSKSFERLIPDKKLNLCPKNWVFLDTLTENSTSSTIFSIIEFLIPIFFSARKIQLSFLIYLFPKKSVFLNTLTENTTSLHNTCVCSFNI